MPHCGSGRRCIAPKIFVFRSGYWACSAAISSFTSCRLVCLSAGQVLWTTGSCSRAAKRVTACSPKMCIRDRCAGVLVIAVGLYGAALILFTLAPPELPVFVG